MRSFIVIVLALAVTRDAHAKFQCPTPSIATPNHSYTCNMEAMPLFNQGNPNLAYVNVPADTWQAELDGQTAVGNFNNPFNKSWLPLGPMWGDEGAVYGNGFYTNTCGATSMAMSYQAALFYRSDATVLKAGNTWTRTKFLGAERPAAQREFPLPLKSANAAGAAQMTRTQLQRALNTYVLTNAVPSVGGGWAYQVGDHVWPYYMSFEGLAADFTAGMGYGVLTTWSAVKSYKTHISITNELLKETLKWGGTGQMHMSNYRVHIALACTSTPCNPKAYITFTREDGSHYTALEGFSVYTDAAMRQTLNITYNDPAYGIQRTGKFVDLTNNVTYAKAGEYPRKVTLPVGLDSTVIWPRANTNTVFDLKDGDIITLMDELYTIYLD